MMAGRLILVLALALAAVVPAMTRAQTLVSPRPDTVALTIYRQPGRTRGAIVVGNGLAEMHDSDAAGSAIKWKLEPGVVGRLGDCEENWCEFSVGERSGFVEANRLWGAGEP